MTAAPVFKVTRDSGEIIHAGALLTDQHGNVVTFLYASRPTRPGKAGKVVVSDGYDGDTLTRREHEHYANVYGLRVARVIPDHDDQVTAAWCRFSGVSSVTGECPVHPRVIAYARVATLARPDDQEATVPPVPPVPCLPYETGR